MRTNFSCHATNMTFSGILKGGGGVWGKALLSWLTCCKLKVDQKCSNFEVADKHDVVGLLARTDGRAVL